MSITSNVGYFRNAFVAILSDGRHIEQPDFLLMARSLVHAGVPANSVFFEWKSGQRMVTAGQQVALRAEMRRLEQAFAMLAMAGSRPAQVAENATPSMPARAKSATIG